MKLSMLINARTIKVGNKFWTNIFVPYQLLGFREHFSNLEIISFFKEADRPESQCHQEFDTDFFQIRGLPYISNLRELYFPKLPLIMNALNRIFQSHSRNWSALILYEAGILSQMGFILARYYGIPTFLWIGGYSKTVSKLSIRHNPIVEIIPRWIIAQQEHIAKNFLAKKVRGIIVTGKDLQKQFCLINQNVHNIVSSGASLSDLETPLPKLRLQDDRETLQIITVSRITAPKGLEYLIEAIAILRERELYPQLDIIGPIKDKYYFDNLTHLITKRNLENQIQFTGEVRHGEELQQLYKKADIFVISSLTEGSPKVIPEAMAKGLPIVATKVGAIPELIAEGEHGYLVEPRNAASLANALERLLRDKKLRYFIGSAVQEAFPNYTIEHQIGEIASWIKALIP